MERLKRRQLTTDVLYVELCHQPSHQHVHNLTSVYLSGIQSTHLYSFQQHTQDVAPVG